MDYYRAEPAMSKLIAFLLMGELLIAQLALGCDPLVVALCGLALVVGLFPTAVCRPDLYTILAAIFAIRYVGVPLVAKTWLHQPLDQYLHAPEAAYGLSALLMSVVVGVIFTVRALDRGTTLYQLPEDVRTLRLLGLLGFVMGALAYVGAGLLLSRAAGATNTGPYVLLVILGGIHLVGLVTETLYSAQRGRALVTFRLILMLAIMFGISMFLNARAILLDGIIAIAVSGILYGALRARHLLGLAIAAVLASLVITPVTLELRRISYGKSPAEFAAAVSEILTKAATDPNYIALLRARQAQEGRAANPLELYDYYEDADSTNAMNRFSYVALVDAIYFRAERQSPLGLSVMKEVYSRIVPGFLVAKEAKPYGYGDWLAWELGIFHPPLKTNTNFSLPMEGYAIAGMLGFIFLPTLFLFTILLVCSRISSLRVPYPSSLVLFGALQWQLIEGNSDAFFIILTRQIPILLVALKCIEILVRHSGDVLELALAGIQDTRQRSRIDAAGEVSRPHFSQLRVAGRPLSELRAMILRLLRSWRGTGRNLKRWFRSGC
jgi:hypothetical protein